jgi:hypothetical protein
VRRALLIALALAGFAGTASAGIVAADGDGTLSVRNADGTSVWMKADGAVVGHFDTGVLRVFDPADGDPVDVSVWGAERTRALTGTTTLYSGENVRFRIVGRFVVRLHGDGIALSAVGAGKVGLEGDSGTYSLNGERRKQIPFDPDGALTIFDLQDSTTGPGPGP